MLPVDLFLEKIAELLELPVGSIRSSLERSIPAHRDVQVSHDIEQLSSPDVISAGEVEQELAPKEREENAIYELWQVASEKDKPDLERQLFNAVLRHSRAVVWLKLQEANQVLANDLAHDIATVVIQSLGNFHQESKFSTWVQGVAQNKIKQEKRRRIRKRRVFDEYSQVFEQNADSDERLEHPQARADFDAADDRINLDRLKEGLSARDLVALECIGSGLSTAETAKKLGVRADAAESRIRRLKLKLRKKYAQPDGK